eukprot:Ihof_evm12s40 gene=Ihof_evmTU12s40
MAQQQRKRDVEDEAMTVFCEKKLLEYKAEGERIASLCGQMGVTPDSMTSQGQFALNTLVSLGLLLGLRDTGKSSCMIGLSNLTSATCSINSELQEVMQTSQSLASTLQALKGLLRARQSTLERLEEQQSSQEPMIEKRGEERAFYWAKVAEYDRDIKDMQ